MATKNRLVTIKLCDVVDLRALTGCAVDSVSVRATKKSPSVTVILRLQSGTLVSAPLAQLSPDQLSWSRAKWRMALEKHIRAICHEVMRRAAADPAFVAYERDRKRRLAQEKLASVRNTL